jgi:nucleotide-binding universal stress UspA family protein
MKILLALDGSPGSTQARDLVASIPWPEGTSLHLLTAYEIPATWFIEGGVAAGDWLSDAEDAMRRQAESDLADMAAALDGRGWTVERRLVRGRAASAILAAGDELDADLIVLGSRGHGRFASILLGSVSAEVSQQAPRSVLVVRADRVTKLLVATDGSASSGVIPAVLGDWGSFRGVPAVALSVAPEDSPMFDLLVRLYTFGNQSLEADRERIRELHRGYAATMAARLSNVGVKTEPEFRSGNPAREIIDAATEDQADLIITGSRYLHGLDQWLLGSVARSVLMHAQTSVLIIRKMGAHEA